MDILNEITEIATELVDTLAENGFFSEQPFISPSELRRELQINMQRKWEQDNDIFLSDDEFIELCSEITKDRISIALADLVSEGLVQTSVNENGELVYNLPPNELNK
jgi:hypothetical protein